MIPEQIEALRGADILVIDDHPVIRLAMDVYFSRLGYRVAALESIDDLRELGTGKTPLRWALALLDLDGVEDSRKLHQTLIWLGFTGVSYLHTGHEGPSALCQDSWIEGVLGKPVSPERLEAIVKDAVSRKHTVGANTGATAMAK